MISTKLLSTSHLSRDHTQRNLVTLHWNTSVICYNKGSYRFFAMFAMPSMTSSCAIAAFNLYAAVYYNCSKTRLTENAFTPTPAPTPTPTLALTLNPNPNPKAQQRPRPTKGRQFLSKCTDTLRCRFRHRPC